MHQAKTGGSTLVSLLRDTFSKEDTYSDRDRQERHGKTKLLRLFEASVDNWRNYNDREAFDVIHGHFLPKKYRRAFPDALYITLYRHPIQQFVSLYHFWLDGPVNPALPMNPRRRILRSEKLSLEEFAKMRTKEKSSKKRAAQLKPENFDFVGITEEFELSLKLLRLKHLPTLAVETKSKLVNPNKKVGNLYEIDGELLELLSTRFALRIRQYTKAVERFWSDCEAAGLASR